MAGARWTARQVALLVGTGTGAVLACWATAAVAGARGPAFAWVASWSLMGVVAVAVRTARPALRARWFAVDDGEARVLTRLGARAYARALRALGWEAVMASQRPFDGTRGSLAPAEHATREAEAAHLVGGGVTAAVVVAALAAGAHTTALWWAAALTAFHAYPVLSQRLVRWRLQRVLELAGRQAGPGYPHRP